MDGKQIMEIFSAIAFGLLSSVVGVNFDVPALAPAQNVSPINVQRQLPESRFVQVSLDISTIVAPQFRGRVSESLIEIRSQHEDVQVADFSPRTEMISLVSGDVHVTSSYRSQREAAVNAQGFYPVFASGDAHASFHDDANRTVEMNQIAPLQMVSAAGTLDRRTGVYFKIKSGPQSVIEGARNFRITLEVPSDWTADLLEVRVSAFGESGEHTYSKSEQTLAAQRYYVAVYQFDHPMAAQTAINFAREHIRLQNEAQRYAGEIARSNMPTPVHKLGRALDLYQPSIPSNWLEQWVFGSQYQKPNVEMPVNLKVVMLDFQDARTAVLNLSHPTAKLAYHERIGNRALN